MVLSIFISFLFERNEVGELVVCEDCNYSLFLLFYAVGQTLVPFSQSVDTMQISNFINTYILEFFQFYIIFHSTFARMEVRAISSVK